ncbi:MAG: ORF6N domain-containing protein [Bacteroidales bacterium]|jgi:hypothetical protein|nr:ORF6N domain-containing protein [Bacteroidales bacterium]
MENSIIIQKQENILELAIIQRIHEIRGMKVMLDFDLAEQYGIETRALKQAVKRNLERFPFDFMFVLSEQEIDSLVSQFVIPSKKRLGGALPFAFTQEGVAMSSGILHSQKAISTNINIMRAFVALRQYVLNYSELKHKLDDFIRETHSKFDQNEIKFDALFNLFDEYIAYKKELEKPRNPIGFKVNRD